LKKVVIALVLVMSLFTLSAMAGEWTGYISDSKCGAKGAKDAHADCAVSCVKGGASPVFVTGGKVYKIDDTSKVTDHVGHKVDFVNGEGDLATHQMSSATTGGAWVGKLGDGVVANDTGVRCYYLAKVHQGVSTADAFTMTG